MNTSNENIFFRFPLNNRSLLEIWLHKIGANETFVPTEDSVVCSAHFRISDYVKENDIYDISPSAFPSVYLKEGDQDAHSNMEDEDDDDDTQIVSPIVIHVRGKKSTDSNVEQLNSNEVTTSKYYRLNECVNNTVNENSQNYVEISNGNKSHIVDSMSNTKINKNIEPCQNNNSEVSNQLYITIDTDQYKMSPSNVNWNKPHGDNITKLRRFRKFKAVDGTSTSSNIKNKCRNRSMITMASKQTQTNPEQRSSNESKIQYKKEVPEKFVNQLRMYARKNKRLIAKLKSVTTRQQDLLDTKIKYLVLKEKVLETEEKLLAYGIDTTEFPAFRFTNNSSQPSPRDPEYDVLLECTLEEIRQTPTHNSSSF